MQPALTFSYDYCMWQYNLRRQAQSNNPVTRLLAASNPRIIELNKGEVLRKLAKNQNPVVRMDVATNPRIIELNNGEVLRKLAKNQVVAVRIGAGKNPRIIELNNGKVMHKLAKNNALGIYNPVPHNPRRKNLLNKARTRNVFKLIGQKSDKYGTALNNVANYYFGSVLTGNVAKIPVLKSESVKLTGSPTRSATRSPSRSSKVRKQKARQKDVDPGKWMGPPNSKGVRAGESFFEPQSTRRPKK